MNILHYALGFPPYRSGGLTKFVIDLIKQQLSEGENASLLWPGEIKIIDTKTHIYYRGVDNGIKSYEVINPTPVSYDEGISNTNPFLYEGDLATYEIFLDNLKPDVIHIHTLMGLHKNLLIAAKRKHIKLVFSAHDFFPICPKVTLCKNGHVCDSADVQSECEICNKSALSINKIKILQSSLYRKIKSTFFIQMLRKKHRNEFLNQTEIPYLHNSCIFENVSKYKQLRAFYKEMLSLMDCIHYNSYITKQVYETYMGTFPSVVVPITHLDINDNRKKREYGDIPLRLSYLGPYSSAKGFFILKSVLDELWKETQNFVLNVYFEQPNLPPYIHTHKRYSYEELESIFDDTDVLIVPSIWYETFGYNVIEALSYAVPIVVSSHVGASCIIPEGAGSVYDAESPQELKMLILSCTKDKLAKMNQCILEANMFMTMPQMSLELKAIYLHKNFSYSCTTLTHNRCY